MMSNKVREAATPNEMRAEIFRLAYIDPLVRSIFRASDIQGLSAEDRYTILAYHALKSRSIYMEKLLRMLDTTINVPDISIPK